MSTRSESAAGTIERMSQARPTRRRWFQFRLWLILVLVTVIAMPFAAFSWVRQWSLNRTELLLLLMADKPACRISVVPAQ